MGDQMIHGATLGDIVTHCHHEAMRLYDESMVLQEGPGKIAKIKEAFGFEWSAAMSARCAIDVHDNPTVAILFRSAATMALNAGMKEEALVCCYYGLRSETLPKEIFGEIMEVMGKALGIEDEE